MKTNNKNEYEEMYSLSEKQLHRSSEAMVETQVTNTVVAGEYELITGQALDVVAQRANSLLGTSFSYEGTHQQAADIAAFNRLNDEAFSKSGVFSSPEKAKAYYQGVLADARDNPRALTCFESKLTGYSQEADWLRTKEGELSSLWEKSSLLNNNAPGVDGETVNRFTGEVISRTTIKASQDPMTHNGTGINGIKDSLEKGTVTDENIICGPVGTEEAARKAGLKNPVMEVNTHEEIRERNERLKEKILNEQATTSPTSQQFAQAAMQGAVIGAGVSAVASSITNCIRCYNGEISKKQALTNMRKDLFKGGIVGGIMGVTTLLLPGGMIGTAAGTMLGSFLDPMCSYLMDDIFENDPLESLYDNRYRKMLNIEDLKPDVGSKYNFVPTERSIHSTDWIDAFNCSYWSTTFMF